MGCPTGTERCSLDVGVRPGITPGGDFVVLPRIAGACVLAAAARAEATASNRCTATDIFLWWFSSSHKTLLDLVKFCFLIRSVSEYIFCSNHSHSDAGVFSHFVLILLGNVDSSS